MTTTVYFDLDGTVLESTAGFGELFAASVPVDPSEAMAVTYSEALLAALEEMSGEPYRTAFAAVCDEHDLDAAPADLAAAFKRHEVEATRLAPPVRDLVETVADRHRAGILTNGDGPMQRRKAAAHGLDELVDAVVVSNEVGARKPDAGIFEAAKDRLPADAFVYVGDSFEEDIVPAEAAGFSTVYVGDDRREEAPVAAADAEALATLLLALLDSESAT